MEWSLPVTTGSTGRGKEEALTPFLESSDSIGMSLFTQKTGKMTYLCGDKIPITCQTWASGRKLRHWALLLYSNVHARGGRASLCSRSSPRSHSQVRKIRKISSEDEFVSPAKEDGVRAELGTPGLTPSAECGVSHPTFLSQGMF